MKKKIIIVLSGVLIIGGVIFVGYRMYSKNNLNPENVYQGEWIEHPKGSVNSAISHYFGLNKSKTIICGCINKIIEFNELGETNIKVIFIDKDETIEAFTKEELTKIYNVIKDSKGIRYNLNAIEHDEKGIISKVEIVECDK